MTIALVLMLAAPPLPEPEQLPDRPDWPDPLVCQDGQVVSSAEEWKSVRKPELQHLFQHYMYGRRPDDPAAIEVILERVDPRALGGTATLKEWTVVTGPAGWPQIELLVLIPNDRRGPVPAFVGLNFTGNHTVTTDPAVRVPGTWIRSRSTSGKQNRATDADRGTAVETWAVDETLKRGYAVATAYYGDIEPDTPDAPSGLRRAMGSSETGAVMAWAWGLSRMADALHREADVDAGRLAVVGHSRLGKAALVAAAFDERFALAVINQAGCGGSAPSRGSVGESVKQINDRFPHWFHDRFKRFNDRVTKLPFDQHALVGLCAPRPVLFTNAVEDTWANPSGQFAVLKAAEPVYRLFHVAGLERPDLPPVGELSGGRLGFFIRPGKHSMSRSDWSAYLDYVDRHFAPVKPN